MNPAEHLPGKINPVCATLCDPVQRRSAWPVNARKPKNMCTQRLPVAVCLIARSAPPFNWRAFINPVAATIPVHPCRREISSPIRRAVSDRFAIAGEYRIAINQRRHRREDVGRLRKGDTH